uniref:RNase H type-1 domain-containing protein n=1 Tax=Hordeum vulgare subsp. vulgare TaxID=112509 RepID=A0A8I6XFA2_HORVV
MHREAELHATMQGMSLALQHSNLPVIVQSDSSEALSSLRGDGLVPRGHVVAEIKELMKDKEFISPKLTRDQNRIGDSLANYSRLECTTAVWLDLGPPCIEDLLSLDCNSLIMK